MNYRAKLDHFKKILSDMGSAVVAFSGGVDSTLLLKLASEVLGNKVLAVLCRSDSLSFKEYNNAVETADELGVEFMILETNELSDENYSSNPPDRCYYCKKIIFTEMIKIAEEKKYNAVIEGSNADDENDYRPGMRALSEMPVRSPLREAGLAKEEIRSIAKDLGLKNWDKPSEPCLSTRVPYGTGITAGKLKMIESAEQYLHDLGLKQVRVRYHGDLARIEVPKEDMDFIIKDDISRRIADEFKAIGFDYISLDILGYRAGSLNETLKE